MALGRAAVANVEVKAIDAVRKSEETRVNIVEARAAKH